MTNPTARWKRKTALSLASFCPPILRGACFSVDARPAITDPRLDSRCAFACGDHRKARVRAGERLFSTALIENDDVDALIRAKTVKGADTALARKCLQT